MGFLDIIEDIAEIAGPVISIFSDFKAADEAKDIGKKQAKAVQQAAKDNAELSLYDAEVAEKAAMEAAKSSQRALVLHGRVSRQLLGIVKTKFAKSGAIVTTGTPVDVYNQTSSRLAEDMKIVEYEGKKAVQQRLSLAERYRLLADKGLRDGVAAANLIEDTAKFESEAFTLGGIQKITGFLGELLT